MTQRSEQVATTLQRAIQSVITRGLADPRIKGLVTVTRVDVAPDFAQATVFCSVTPHDHQELSIHGMRAASTWIRRQVAEQVRFRKMPKFNFKIDDQLQRQQEVLSSIAEARREDEKREQMKQKDR